MAPPRLTSLPAAGGFLTGAVGLSTLALGVQREIVIDSRDVVVVELSTDGDLITLGSLEDVGDWVEFEGGEAWSYDTGGVTSSGYLAPGELASYGESTAGVVMYAQPPYGTESAHLYTQTWITIATFGLVGSFVIFAAMFRRHVA
ncbi:MAG: hypothetical protein AAGI46_04545 [Planctomycetota bacterium]